ncbi:MAG: AmmeMemoRadiSam system protein B, partial [Candidatus Omnitrophota bacterium]
MANVNFAQKGYPVSGIRILRIIFIVAISYQLSAIGCFAQDIKEPDVAGAFYPSDPVELSAMIDGFLSAANPEKIDGQIFGLICPHAGYGFSGQTAAFGYKLIQAKPYKTVVIIGVSHFYGFGGISVYPQGKFRTPLGDLEIDSEFAKNLLNQENGIVFDPEAFKNEHSLEVQLPFLQKVLSDFKIVPIITGDTSLSTYRKLAQLLKQEIATRQDVLVIASCDMYHGYDYQEAQKYDELTLSSIENMDAEGIYYGLRQG